MAKIEVSERNGLYEKTLLETSLFPNFAEKKIQFASYSEAACALANERLIPNWQCISGQTFQVPLLNRSTADFRIKDTIVEYHPIILEHEFTNRGQGRRFLQIQDRLRPHDLQCFNSTLVEEFSIRYYSKRRHLMDNSSNEEIRKCSLIVAQTFEDYARDVLVKFSGVSYNAAINTLVELYNDLPRRGSK